MGMKTEIQQALEAHSAWRKHFKDFLSGRTSLDVSTVVSTDQCAFGEWLKQEGYRLMPTQMHGDISKAHAEFHQVAAGIVQKIKDKRFIEAHADVVSGGTLDQASARLAELLLKAVLRKPGPKNS